MKSFMIPKRLSEAMNRRMTDNAMTKGKKTSNNLQDTIQETKDRATRTPLKTWGELMCSGWGISSGPRN